METKEECEWLDRLPSFVLMSTTTVEWSEEEVVMECESWAGVGRLRRHLTRETMKIVGMSAAFETASVNVDGERGEDRTQEDASQDRKWVERGRSLERCLD